MATAVGQLAWDIGCAVGIQRASPKANAVVLVANHELVPINDNASVAGMLTTQPRRKGDLGRKREARGGGAGGVDRERASVR